jgi:CMP-N,N'-diacetyllegionaminic acid synthase
MIPAGRFVLAVIPARGGSKGIKDKNIRPLAGKPLIAFSIEAAKSSELLGDFLVSTDSKRIAEIARSLGAPVPFLRPASLAQDSSPTVDTLIHAVEWYEREKGRRVDAVAILQPTAPLRLGSDIDAALQIFFEGKARSLFSCFQETSSHPLVMYIEAEGLLKPLLSDHDAVVRRQDFPPVYVRNGAIYIASRELVIDERRIRDDRSMLYLMPRERSVNIDELDDFEEAERALAKREGFSA